ncbi:class I SAM-dependent DNA methyltransferase [Lysinibacillus sp. NPDC097195]|uniref:class I SAM-dependent DNA methyltransferase n=1 Tax=Lysinibacillus sp. NPDC097195 TaxID=3364141 RepID=UPI0037FCA8C0
MTDSIINFYDELAEDYHLIFIDWHESIARQSEVLHNIIQSKLNLSCTDIIRILDCSCGIGTQAIGLANYGYNVTATDLSAVSVKRAIKEAANFGVKITFGVADFRTLHTDVSGIFNIVLSADNAIPHLISDEDLYQAFHNMHAKLDQNGLLIVTIRDYDAMVKKQITSTKPNVFDNGNRMAFQIYDWAQDGKTYTVHQFIMQRMNTGWKTKQYSTLYRAWLREELNKIMQATGFVNVEWHFPSQTGYYQPILTARKVE